MIIVRADFITGTAEIVVEILFDVGLDLCLGVTCAGQEDGSGRSFRPP